MLNNYRKGLLKACLLVAIAIVGIVSAVIPSEGVRNGIWMWRPALASLSVLALAMFISRAIGHLHGSPAALPIRRMAADLLRAVSCWIGALCSAVLATRYVPDALGGFWIVGPTVLLIGLGAFFLVRALGLLVSPR